MCGECRKKKENKKMIVWSGFYYKMSIGCWGGGGGWISGQVCVGPCPGMQPTIVKR